DTSGHRQRTFSLDDEITVGGKKFGAPWAITDYAVTGADASRQVAISAHHYTWSPSVVTVLDASWHRQGTFVNAGWIETLQWVGPQRLVAGGFHQDRDAGLAVLIDTTK